MEFNSSLTSSGPATITLDGDALELDHTSSGSLIIQGPTNHPLTINQDSDVSFTIGDFAAFQVDSGSTAVINNLTISGGYKSALRYAEDIDGGGIDSSGTLTINDCLIAGNTAQLGGGIYQSGSDLLTINNSTITGNVAPLSGGGIFGTNVTISDSTISNNYASYGGGIGTEGLLTITGSTISGNTAASAGGGIITVSGGTVSISASTIALNQGDGGSGLDLGGSATINDTTIDDNFAPDWGTGLYGTGDSSTGVITLQGSIVSDNGGNLCGYFTMAEDLIGDTELTTGTTLIPYGDVYGEAILWGTSADLAPLGSYGGPTETMPPLPGSPAIDAFETDDGLTRSTDIDQRGFAMGNDLGAFQTQFSPLDVNTTADDPIGSGDLSLRDAVNLANAMGGNQTITFDSALTTGTINLTGTAIEMQDTTGTLTIDGTDSTTDITVNAASGSGAFTLDASSFAKIDGVTIGGAVTTAGTLTLNGDINPTANTFSVEVLDGGLLNLPTSTDLASLTIDAGGIAKQTSIDATFGDEVLTVGALTIDGPSGSTNGGVLDLGNGDLIVQDTAASGIYTLLEAGYDGGWWDGLSADGGANPAAITSSAAANDPYRIESLGYSQIGTETDDGDLNLSTFDGQSVSSGDTVVELTYYGDATLDRTVNSTDYDLIGAEYPYTSGDIGGWTGGDFNYDGAVDGADLDLFDNTVAMLAAPNKDHLTVEAGTNDVVQFGATGNGTFVIKVTDSSGTKVDLTGKTTADVSITPSGLPPGATLTITAATVNLDGNLVVTITETGLPAGGGPYKIAVGLAADSSASYNSVLLTIQN